MSVQRLLQLLQQQGIQDQRVLKAIAQVPRDYFIQGILAHKAYDNTALPIGQGQTISQPYIVARMSEVLCQQPRHKILEIGTGSGYQTAILALLFDKVVSVERIKALQYQAKRRLNQLDLHNVTLRHGDGWQGWASQAPYDAIIVTAAAKEVPQALVDQLAIGGTMIIPVGEQVQSLYKIEKTEQGIRSELLEQVRFVPLIEGEII